LKGQCGLFKVGTTVKSLIEGSILLRCD